MKTSNNTPGAPMPIGPYNQSISAGGMLYISGQIPIDPVTGDLVKGDIEQETAQVLRNIRAILQSADLTLDDIVKCSVFVKNMDDFSRINDVYSKFFDGTVAPARELVEVVRLPKNANIEISAIALIK